MKNIDKNDWILSNILKLRILKNKQGPEIAKELGIAQGTYSKLENGKIKNYFDYLPKIANALGVSFHDLVKYEPSINQIKYASNDNREIEGNTNSNDFVITEKLILHCEETIKTLLEMNELVIQERDYYKRKYKFLKVKLNTLEENIIKNKSS